MTKLTLHLVKSTRRRLASITAMIVVIALLVNLIPRYFTKPVSAAWFDEAWSYRTAINFGNTGSADTDKKVKFDIDTATLITAGKMQSDCGDSRFTDINGRALKYFIDTAGGTCNTNSTDYYVLV